MHSRTGRLLFIVLFVVLAGTYVLYRRPAPAPDEIGKPEPVPAVTTPDPLFAVEPPASSPVRVFTRSALAGQDLFALAQAADRLPETLNHGEQAALIHFLLQSASPEAEGVESGGASPAVHHDAYIFLANQVMNALLRQRHEHPMMAEGLISLWQDVSLDSTVRDYAVQHLGAWLRRHAAATAAPEAPEPQTPEPASPEVSRVIETLFAAAHPGHGHSSGTALLALHYALPPAAPSPAPASPQAQAPAPPPPPPLDPQRLQDAVQRLAMDPAHPVTARCTALQIAAQRGWRDVLPEARRILATAAPPPQLAASAAALVGALGDLETDGPGLRRGLESTDPRIATSTQAALARLELKSANAF